MCPQYKDYAALPLRLGLGLIFFAHGGQKLFGWFGGNGISGVQGFMESLGIVPANFWAWVVSLAEFGSGVMLLLGLLTSVATTLIIIDMIVAIIKVHWTKGFFVGGGGYEFNLLIILSAVTLSVLGAQKFSLDEKLSKRKEMTS